MLLQYRYFSYAKLSPFLFVFNANTTQLWGENGHDKSAPTPNGVHVDRYYNAHTIMRIKCKAHLAENTIRNINNPAYCAPTCVFIRHRLYGLLAIYNTTELKPPPPLRAEILLLPTKCLAFQHTRTRLVE